MPRHNEAFAAVAAMEANWARTAKIQAAKSPEQVLRERISGQVAMARSNLQLAKDHRIWRAKMVEWNPQGLGFFGDRVPMLMRAVARHRRSALQLRAELRALQAVQKRAA